MGKQGFFLLKMQLLGYFVFISQDAANLLINKRLASSTVLHHLAVFLAYGHVLRESAFIYF